MLAAVVVVRWAARDVRVAQVAHAVALATAHAAQAAVAAGALRLVFVASWRAVKPVVSGS